MSDLIPLYILLSLELVIGSIVLYDALIGRII